MTKKPLEPICGTDLERWRLENGLSKVAAADAFGLQKAKWEELTSPERSTQPVTDPAVALVNRREMVRRRSIDVDYAGAEKIESH